MIRHDAIVLAGAVAVSGGGLSPVPLVLRACAARGCQRAPALTGGPLSSLPPPSNRAATTAPPTTAAVALRAAAEGDGELADVDGWSLAEPDGRLQWLFGLYRVSALDRAAAVLGDPTDRSMGALLGGLRLRAVPALASITTDIDTPEDLDRWTP